MAVRRDRLAAGTGVAARLAAAAFPLVAAGAAIGAAAGGSGGAVGGIVAAGVLLAGAGTYGDRIALSAMAARPVSEVERPELYRLVRELSKAARLPVPGLYLSPARPPNAFTVGRGPRSAALCATAGLLDSLDEAELRGVLGHELAHISGRDILPATLAAAMATVITFPAALTRWRPGRARAGAAVLRPAVLRPAVLRPAVLRPPVLRPAALRPPAGDGAPGSLGVLERAALLLLGPVAAVVIRLSVTNGPEYRADAAGALLSGDPAALARALRTVETGAVDLPLLSSARLISVGHLMLASPFSPVGLARLFVTQPATGERLRRLEALAGYRR